MAASFDFEGSVLLVATKPMISVGIARLHSPMGVSGPSSRWKGWVYVLQFAPPAGARRAHVGTIVGRRELKASRFAEMEIGLRYGYV